MAEKVRGDASPSLAYVPPQASRDELSSAIRECRAWERCGRATRAVLGEGPAPAKMMLVGEQPGSAEDATSRPFAGPAGPLLNAALEEAEIPRDQVYLTNVLKHFKCEQRGDRRMHAKPTAFEIHACRGWLEAEVRIVAPQVIVCLGAVAAQVFLGRKFRLKESHGVLLDGTPWAPRVVATYHPSALLRMKNESADYARARRDFTLDLAEAASIVSFRTQRLRHLPVISSALL
jgi:DNA polymerase